VGVALGTEGSTGEGVEKTCSMTLLVGSKGDIQFMGTGEDTLCCVVNDGFETDCALMWSFWGDCPGYAEFVGVDWVHGGVR
jgi:hypothetical protein